MFGALAGHEVGTRRELETTGFNGWHTGGSGAKIVVPAVLAAQTSALILGETVHAHAFRQAAGTRAFACVKDGDLRGVRLAGVSVGYAVAAANRIELCCTNLGDGRAETLEITAAFAHAQLAEFARVEARNALDATANVGARRPRTDGGASLPQTSLALAITLGGVGACSIQKTTGADDRYDEGALFNDRTQTTFAIKESAQRITIVDGVLHACAIWKTTRSMGRSTSRYARTVRETPSIDTALAFAPAFRRAVDAYILQATCPPNERRARDLSTCEEVRPHTAVGQAIGFQHVVRTSERGAQDATLPSAANDTRAARAIALIGSALVIAVAF